MAADSAGPFPPLTQTPMDEPTPSPILPDSVEPRPGDWRVYVPEAEQWTVHIMTGVEREYCHQQAPGQEYYHLIVPGEVYLQSGPEKLCLNCALRRGAATHDRLYWQVRKR